MATGGKQTPATEVTPVEDSGVHLAEEAKVGSAMASAGRTPKSPSFAGVVTPGGKLGESPTSVWDNWVAASKAKLNSPPNSMKSRIASARADRSARSTTSTAIIPGEFDSKLATASGYTNTGPQATKNRQKAMMAAASAEAAEIADLKMILGRTLYTGGANSYKRAGDVATASLQKLDDGQADSVAKLRARREAEEMAASVKTGRPRWDSSVHSPCPPALKGCKPITPEPWARDAAAYESGMSSHGFKQIDTGVETTGSYKTKKQVSIESLQATIQNDMANYRRDLGAGKKAPVSARHLRAWSDAGSIPPTPKSGKLTGRNSARYAGKYSAPANTPHTSGRADKIKARAEAKEKA